MIPASMENVGIGYLFFCSFMKIGHIKPCLHRGCILVYDTAKYSHEWIQSFKTFKNFSLYKYYIILKHLIDWLRPFVKILKKEKRKLKYVNPHEECTENIFSKIWSNDLSIVIPETQKRKWINRKQHFIIL